MGVPWCILVYSTDFRLPFLLITYPEMASRFLGDWGTWISPWGLLPISRHGLVMWASGVLRTAPKKEPQCFCVLEGTLGKSQAGAAHTVMSPALLVGTLQWKHSVSEVQHSPRSHLHSIVMISPLPYVICHGSCAVPLITLCVLAWLCISQWILQQTLLLRWRLFLICHR